MTSWGWIWSSESSAGAPILPTNFTGVLVASKSVAISEEVVPLPLVPVIPMTEFFIAEKKSRVTVVDFLAPADLSQVGGTDGLRTIRS